MIWSCRVLMTFSFVKRYFLYILCYTVLIAFEDERLTQELGFLNLRRVHQGFSHSRCGLLYATVNASEKKPAAGSSMLGYLWLDVLFLAASSLRSASRQMSERCGVGKFYPLDSWSCVFRVRENPHFIECHIYSGTPETKVWVSF